MLLFRYLVYNRVTAFQFLTIAVESYILNVTIYNHRRNTVRNHIIQVQLCE